MVLDQDEVVIVEYKNTHYEGLILSIESELMHTALGQQTIEYYTIRLLQADGAKIELEVGDFGDIQLKNVYDYIPPNCRGCEKIKEEQNNV